jgi:hypothetical protein
MGSGYSVSLQGRAGGNELFWSPSSHPLLWPVEMGTMKTPEQKPALGQTEII